MATMRYRLALDLGSTSLGWAMVRLNSDHQPNAVIKTGVRIFSDGRNPKDGSSLAVTRREARAMRRRRDRLLKRKARMMDTLVRYGFFPADPVERQKLVLKDPYQLRARGLDEPLQPEDFARALFHINQRRGFKSNRKTDKKENDAGALKAAISKLRAAILAEGCRTVGEWLYRRSLTGQTVRARYREARVPKDDGKFRLEKSYDLYIDRAMVEAEFDALWAKQASLNPEKFNEQAWADLKDCLLHQRPLKPVKPGRCTLLPDLERAPLALPTTQRFRILQEVNNLRLQAEGLAEVPLTVQQRDLVVDALEKNRKRSFAQIRKLLSLPGTALFNLEDAKRSELKGNATSAELSRKEHFGPIWFDLSEDEQDAVVLKLVTEENEAALIRWLTEQTGVNEAKAEAIANAGLPEGYGSLSQEALRRILPALRQEVVTYDKAVIAGGFDHHSHLSHAASGEILPNLPYYGVHLSRHVGFGSGNAADSDEKRYGRIANPTVHIGLNQVREVVNALIARYGHPSEVIVEVARDLKQSQEQRREETERQAKNQQRNQRIRSDIAHTLQISEERVKGADIQKFILWEELNPGNAADRRCPYSGRQISVEMLLSEQVEIEHILPFSQTLDDSMANKTVALREANRIKGNHTPWDAFGKQAVAGYDYAAILQRAELMARNKRYRFAEDGYQRWLKEDKGFLARALNDTRYLSRVAREYLSLICPQATRVIPGQMTAMLRRYFGLNNVLGHDGEKNRNDHRHHAIDACVIAVTDQGMLQQFASASANARERQLNRLVEDMPLPWDTYREHVARAVHNIWVSHKPDHGHQGAMHNDTAYGLLDGGRVRVHKMQDGKRTLVEEALKVIPFADAQGHARHGALPDGSPRPYKGYKGDSNYCLEIYPNEKGKWEGEVISTFQAYQYARTQGEQSLYNKHKGISGHPLIARFIIGDYARFELDGELVTMRVASINAAGRLTLASHEQANTDARNRAADGEWRYTYKQAGSLQSAKGRKVTVSPIGELRDPGFRG